MKFRFLFLFFVSIVITKALHGQCWKSLGGSGFSESGVSGVSLILDQSGAPYIGFSDDAHESKATVLRFNGTGWDAVGSPGFSPGSVSALQLGRGVNDTLYVAFNDDANGHRATVMKYNGTVWEFVGSGFSDSTASASSFAFDSTGVAYAGFIDVAYGNRATVKKYVGDAWVTLGFPGFSAGWTGFVTMSVKGTVPYVAYEDGGSLGRATVMKYTGGAWAPIGPEGITVGDAKAISLTVDDSGRVYLFCEDEGLGQKGVVWQYNGSSWGTVGTPAFTVGKPWATSIAKDNFGAIYVAYMDWSLALKTIVKKYSGSSWQDVGTGVLSSGASGYGHPLVIDATGAPYVAYADGAMGDKATVKKLTSFSPITGPATICEGSIITLGNATSSGTWTCSNYNAAAGATNGITEGIVAGTIVISYTLISTDSVCITTSSMTVNPFSAGEIYGPASVSAGSSITLTDSLSGGTWSTSSSSIATIGGSSGVVTGVAAGSATITYSKLTSCGMAFSTYELLVYETGVSCTPWSIVGGHGIAPVDNTMSFAMDNNDVPYVVYDDSYNSHRLTVRKYSGGSWQVVGTAGLSAAFGYLPSMVFDSTNIPYVAYQDYANGARLTVKKYNGSSWATVGIAGFSAGPARVPSMVLDRFGQPYVAYIEEYGGMTVMKFNGSGWEVVGTAAFAPASSLISASASLAIDRVGTPYVAFSDESNNERITVMKYNGSSWVLVGQAGFSTPLLGNISLAIDTSGIPYVAYPDSASGQKATVKKFDGTKWVGVGRPSFSDGYAWNVSLAIDHNNTAFVTYSDGAQGNKATLKKYNGSSWINVGNPGFSPVYEADEPKVAIDSHGTPYVAFRGYYIDGTLVTVMKYTSSGIGAISGSSIVCAGSSITLSDTSIGGRWSSTSALVNIGSATGVTSGQDAGSAIISYTLGTCIATTTVTVNSGDSITGASAVSAGDAISLLATVAGGTWNSSNTAVATIGSTGIVTGITPGIAIMSYTISGSCGPLISVHEVSVYDSGVVCTKYWQTVGIAGLSGGSAPYVASAVYGVTPYVAFKDNVAGGKATVMKFNGISWSVVGTAGFSAGAIGDISIAISKSGVPYVSFIDNASSSKTTVMQFDGGNWSVVGTAGFSAGSASNIVIALDSSGSPFVAFMDHSTSDPQVAAVMKYDGSSWSNVGSSRPSESWVNDPFISLVVDDAGSPYVAFEDGAHGSRLTVTKFNGINWEPVGDAGFVPGYYPTIAVYNGISYVAYMSLSGSQIAVRKYNGSNWALMDSSSLAINGAYATMAINSRGIPYVAFEGVGTTYRNTVKKFENGVWQTVGEAAFSAGGNGNNINPVVFDTSGVPYLAFKDDDNSGKVTVMKFAGGDISSVAGPGTVCAGNTVTLSHPTAGGEWSSSGASGVDDMGVVYGSSSGTSTISYTVAGCVARRTVTVLTSPGTISGFYNLCNGSSTTLSNSAAGGTWSSGTPGVAIIGSSTGIIAGVGIGTTAVSYTLSNGCYKTVTGSVNAVPSVTGAVVCSGTSTTLSASLTGGTWLSANVAVATVDAEGVITGAAAGTASITYTLPSGCFGSAVVTVNAAPGAVSGTAAICAGIASTLGNSVSGGTWSSSSGNVTIGSMSGIVTGIGLGIAVITYTLPSTCFVTKNVTVSVGPSLSGAVVCAGATTALSASPAGGTWVSGNTSVVTVNSAGIVTGVSGGTTGITYTSSTGCSAAAVVTVNPTPGTITGPTTICDGVANTLSNSVSGGAWSSSNSNATIGSVSGVITGAAVGTVVISYTLPAGCYTAIVVTVNGVHAITGSMNTCVGTSIILSDATGGGGWFSSNTGIATVDVWGAVTGVSPGVVNIAYAATTSCGIGMKFATVTVNVTPTVGEIAGSTSVSIGSTITLTDSTAGGTWFSSSPGVASMSNGVVTGVSAGTTIVAYAVPTICGIITKFAVVTVGTSAIPPITGTYTVCAGSATALSNSAGGGTWSSSSTSIATVNSSGMVTGIAAGTATISYVTAAGTATAVVTVNAVPGITTISGTGMMCAGASTTLSAGAGGTWSSGNAAVATIGSTGIVSGVATGTAIVTYTLTNGCGSSNATTQVTVNPLPNAGAISGSASICPAAITTLSSTVGGGTWSSSNTSVATVGSASGMVTGVSSGTAVITYTATNSCGSATATSVVTVSALPTAGVISGGAAICPGATSSLSSTASGGVWTSSDGAIATAGSSTGVVAGVSAGMATISYGVSNGCTTAYASVVVTVNASPDAGTISGPTSVLSGATITLSSTVTGGTWGSSNSGIASIGTTGIVSGGSAGVVTISYTVTNGCGSVSATWSVTVTAAVAGITGTLILCAGSTTTLSNITAGGTWSSSDNTIASITPAGVVSGVAAGIAVITYSAGSGYSTAMVTVNAQPAVITGVASLCEGATTTLGTTTTGGAWSSTNAGVATVGTAGVVNGVSAGTAVVSYTNNGCARVVVVTVNAQPAAIGGTMSLCPGAVTTLTDAVGGGIWSAGAATVATIGSTGVLTAVGMGTTSVSYTIGGTCIVTAIVTVGTAPATITGTMKACPGTSTTLSDMTAGGTWSTSDIAIATAGAATGVVTGVMGGTVTVTYSTGAGCYRTTTVTINPAPAAIAGAAVICAGSSVTLTDVTPGLSWTSGNTTVATIGAGTGVVTGVSTGFATITYTAASTNCIATAIMTVNGIPAAIGGPATGCTGSNITLTNSMAGGAWSSSNTATATVDATTGVVTGVASGIVTITYTTGAGCYKTKAITINNSPTVSGYPTVCIGLTTTLSGGGSGTWISGNPSVATVVMSGGYVTGVAAGTAVMTFTSGTTTCATGYTVTVMPVPAAITGITTACTGTIVTLGNTTPGGSWSSSNTAGATVGSTTGIVNAVGTGGTVTISYSFGTNCRVTTPFTLKPLPAVIAGSPSVCMPVTTTLTTTTSGGTWTSSHTSVATIGTAISASYGLVTGVSSGTSNITYTITATGCARSTVISVDAGLNPGTITSSGGFTLHTVSAPTSLTLSSTGAAGGIWSSSNTAVATVNPTTGVVTAVGAGSTTITYAVTANCTNIVTRVVNVVASRPGRSGPSFAEATAGEAVSSVQLYPNPTSGAFTLVSDEAGTLHLFSIDGKEITNYSISAGINSLSLPKELAAGVYMCRYTSESGNTTMVRLVYEK